MNDRNEQKAKKGDVARESVQQHPSKGEVKGVKTPEPPQVKDPSDLPTSDQNRPSKAKERN